MTLTNVRTIYSFSNSVDTLSINGDVTVKDNKISQLNGNITVTKTGKSAGYASYTLVSDSSVNKNISGVDISDEVSVDNLINTTIAAINTEIASSTSTSTGTDATDTTGNT